MVSKHCSLKRYLDKHLKMSVIKAILFYSKRDNKSFRMKKVIDSVGADIEAISVDVLEIRERLQEDENFGIEQVPTILILYSSGQHKTLTTGGLDQWFEQLLQNMQQVQQPSTALQPSSSSHGVARGQEPLQPPTQIDRGIPKTLRIKPGSTEDIPISLPSPGKPMQERDNEGFSAISGGGSGMSGSTQISGLGEISSAQAAIVSEHIREADPLIPITSEEIQPGRKEVVKEGLSAAELAKQMAEQRETFDENLEQNRPF